MADERLSDSDEYDSDGAFSDKSDIEGAPSSDPGPASVSGNSDSDDSVLSYDNVVDNLLPDDENENQNENQIGRPFNFVRPPYYNGYNTDDDDCETELYYYMKHEICEIEIVVDAHGVGE